MQEGALLDEGVGVQPSVFSGKETGQRGTFLFQSFAMQSQKMRAEMRDVSEVQ